MIDYLTELNLVDQAMIQCFKKNQRDIQNNEQTISKAEIPTTGCMISANSDKIRKDIYGKRQLQV